MPIFGEFETAGEPLARTEEHGHLSTVWQARKHGDSHVYVVKHYVPRRRVLNPGEEDTIHLHKDPGLEFIEGIKQTRKALAEGGRGLAPVYDFGALDSGVWYASDFYPRKNLSVYIQFQGRVDGPALRHIGFSVVTGCLALKRSRGYSHGNLKPSNVFLGGKVRPLHQTPVLLTDAYPAAPVQLAALDAADQREVGELLHQVVGAQDVRAIGELMLQLVEGRLFSRPDDYNYPVGLSPAWQALGKEAEYWLRKCNQLLDPRLTPEAVSLESLQEEWKPSALAGKTPLLIAAGAGVVVLGLAVFLGLNAMVRGREAARLKAIQAAVQSTQQALDAKDLAAARKNLDEVTRVSPAAPELEKLKSGLDNLVEQTYNQAAKAADAAMGRRDYAEAGKQAELALSAKPGDAAATRLRDDARAEASYQAMTNQAVALYRAGRYDDALTNIAQALGVRSHDMLMTELKTKAQDLAGVQHFNDHLNAAKAALQALRYDEALSNAQLARVISPTNETARVLERQALQGKHEQEAATKRENDFQAAISAAQAAATSKDYPTMLGQAQAALVLKPNDPTALKLKSDAQAGINAAAAAAQTDKDYRTAVSAAQAAAGRKDYQTALTQAQAALALRPNDPVALKLKSDAQAAIDAASSAAKTEKDYQAAIAAAQTAAAGKDYPTVLRQAQAALALRPNDPVALKLKSDAQAAMSAAAAAEQTEKDYQAAVTAAQAAVAAKDYAKALSQAQAALALKPNDPTALKLRSDAQAATSAAAAAEQTEKDYQAAITAAQATVAAKEYAKALSQAQAALALKPNDPTALKLRSDAQAAMDAAAAAAKIEKDYQAAITAAQAAVAAKDYAKALSQAQAALTLKPNDPTAVKLKNDAQQAMAGTQPPAHPAVAGFAGIPNLDFVWVPGLGGAGAYVAVNELSWGQYKALRTLTTAAGQGRDGDDLPANLDYPDAVGLIDSLNASSSAAKLNLTQGRFRLLTQAEYSDLLGISETNGWTKLPVLGWIPVPETVAALRDSENIAGGTANVPRSVSSGAPRNQFRYLLGNVREWTEPDGKPFGIACSVDVTGSNSRLQLDKPHLIKAEHIGLRLVAQEGR